MSDYGIFFSGAGDKKVYRLPVNPESIKISSNMATETFNILNANGGKGGQIVVPSHLELKKVSFECEFTSTLYHYVETQNEFYPCEYYENLFQTWREKLIPIRLTIHGVGSDITMMVLIEGLDIKESADNGTGDKIFSFELIEYAEYEIVEMKIDDKGKTKKTTKKNNNTEKKNPNNSGTYVVKKGDSLWKIAKLFYGKGSEWKKIYNANKDKIKNPNLIYPNQKLVIPK